MAVKEAEKPMKLTHQIFSQILALIILVFVIFPVLWIIGMSLDPRNIARPTTLFPPSISFDAYIKVFQQPTPNPVSFGRLAANSTMLAVGVSILTVLVGTTAAYAFSRFRFPGRQPGMLFFILVLMLPSVATVAALFVMLNILLGPQQQAMLSDYGITGVSSNGAPVAAPNAYVLHRAPEVVATGNIGVGSDIFQVGMTLARLLIHLDHLGAVWSRIGPMQFEQDIAAGKLPGAVVMVARRGKLVYSEAFGVRDPATGAAMTTDSVFRIYSMTKPLVSVAAMMLVEDGRMQLTDPVSKFLPAYKPAAVSVAHTDAEFARITYSTASPLRGNYELVNSVRASDSSTVVFDLATPYAGFPVLLTLGIPTSNTTAILLGAFQNYGIQPGPQLFTTSAALVWALIASLYIGNFMLLVLNLPMVGLWVKLLKIPKPQLYAGILIFATVGAYGMRQSAFDLVLLYGIGVLGVLMRRFDFPTAPVVVGMILGPLAEAQMRNAVSIGEGSFMVFLQRPMSLTLLVVIALVLILPRLFKRRAARLAAG